MHTVALFAQLLLATGVLVLIGRGIHQRIQELRWAGLEAGVPPAEAPRPAAAS